MATYNYDKTSGKSSTTLEPLEPLLDVARSTLSEVLANASRPILAFSGGKDSIVAAILAAEFGVREAVCESSFVADRQAAGFQKAADAIGLDVTYKQRLSWGWLRDNPRWVFPPLSEQSKFYAMRQQASVREYAKSVGADVVIFGRRLEENTVPRPVYKTRDGVTQCHPLRSMKTQHIWDVIRGRGVPYPDIYDHPIGKKEGNTPLTIIPQGHFEDPYAQIYDYAPEFVEKMAAYFLPGAAQFLEGI